MVLNPKQQPVPTGLDGPGFALRRQHPSHSDADYQAVMDSVALLRAWSHSSWPEDDFTPEQNAADLAEHIGDFERDLAYGYSIFDEAEERLLGSLYIDPVAPFAADYQVDEPTRARLAGYDARIEYWLRRGTREVFERAFVTAVSRWLQEAWWFERVTFGSRQPMEERRALYRGLGLTEEVRLVSHDERRVFTFNARPRARDRSA